jgi:4-alpha-glucanotransferase
MKGMAKSRASGVLFHITSLSGPHGSGDLGPRAHEFLHFLKNAKQRYWQVLPIHPVGPGFSPYAGSSAFAGNPLLISLEELVSQGLLRSSELKPVPEGEPVDYPRVTRLREHALRKAFARFREKPRAYAAALDELRTRERFWLEDYALFCAARAHHGDKSWTSWPRELLHREPHALSSARKAWADEITFVEFTQLMFERQWQALRAHAHELGIELIGDVPIFVAHESADVWAHQWAFRLDGHGKPTHVSGVPPDYFSATGQRWGTPLYRWKALAADGYSFWVERMRGLFRRFDLVRLDHFVGFARYWEIPAGAETAVEGRWVKGPRDALFQAIRRALGPSLSTTEPLPLIAEDLGSVTRSVTELRQRLGLPSMRVLQFGFAADGKPDGTHVLHNFPRRSVAYTGTHDTNTLIGWLEEGGDGRGKVDPIRVRELRRVVLDYLYGPEAKAPPVPIHLGMIRALFASPARTAIVPIQDWLGLGAEARMNVPGRADGNWTFRLPRDALSDELCALMGSYSETYGRHSSSQTESEPGGQVKSASP